MSATAVDAAPYDGRATDLAALARRFGTPAYVYDLGAVRRAARALTADVPAGSRVLYSVKANPHPLLVGELAAQGLDAEVSSTGELATALAAGHRPDRMLYTGPGKTEQEVAQALAAGVRRFSVESVTDRDRVARCGAAAGVDTEYLVRLNGPRGSSGGSLRMTGRPTAFGVDTSAAGRLAALFRPRGGARPIGTHTFSATNVQRPQALLEEFEQALRTAAHAMDGAGFRPEVLDLGGGFPAPWGKPGALRRHPELATGLATALDTHYPDWRRGRPEILFESGRYLTATAGTLLTTVVDVKQSGGRTFTVLDAGVNALGGMTGIGRLRAPGIEPFPLDSAGSEAGPGTERAAAPVTSTVVGPLCTPLDVLGTAAVLASPRPGQVLAVPNVGAYGLTASLVGFLGRPAPVEVVVDDGRVLSARRLELRSQEV
ncbi:type III PLP-dependent enzyme [Streptomyces sp. NPDC001761]